MDNQRVSILKQKNKMGLTVLSIVLCIVLSPLLGMTIALPQVLVLLPVVLLALLGFAGPVSALVCCVLIAALCGWLFGAWGAVSMGLFLLPTLIVSALMIERQQPFWQSVAAGVVAAFVSMGAAIALLSLLAGSDVVTALTGMIRPAFETLTGWGDSMLVMMVQMGLFAQPEGFEAAVAAGALTPEIRSELIGGLEIIMDASLRLEIPKQMTTGSIAIGLLGQAVLRKGLRSRGDAVEFPPLRTWRIPSGWGRVLGITFAAFLLFYLMMPAMFETMYYVFSGIFRLLFALQGIAAVCYMLHSRGRGSKMQALVFMIGYFFAAQIAELLGIMDQAVDLTHRRKEFEIEGKDPGPL